jgi:hypothetical protein
MLTFFFRTMSSSMPTSMLKFPILGLTRHSEATVTGSGSPQFSFAAPELFSYLGEDDSDSDDDAQLMARSQRSDIYAFGCLYYEVRDT